MEFLVSRLSIESHTFIAAWDEFCLILEDVVFLTGLPLFEETMTIKLLNDSEKVAPHEEGETNCKL